MSRPPRPPRDLDARGRALWRWVVTAYELDPPELGGFVELARTMDLCERLADELAGQPLTVEGSKGQDVPHPLLGELRQQRDLASRLVARLGLPDDGDATSNAQYRFAQAGARARWGYSRPKVVGGRGA